MQLLLRQNYNDSELEFGYEASMVKSRDNSNLYWPAKRIKSQIKAQSGVVWRAGTTCPLVCGPHLTSSNWLSGCYTPLRSSTLVRAARDKIMEHFLKTFFGCLGVMNRFMSFLVESAKVNLWISLATEVFGARPHSLCHIVLFCLSHGFMYWIFITSW